MKLFHLWNSLHVEYDERRFQEGNKWFFDRDTLLNAWLDTHVDEFYVYIFDADESTVYETTQHIDNRTIGDHVNFAQAAGKLIIKGAWDTPGSHQFFIGPETRVDGKITFLHATDLRSFIETT